MQKFGILEDEWYPVFSIDENDEPGDYHGGVVELSIDDVTDYHRVMAEFDGWQERLGKLARQ